MKTYRCPKCGEVISLEELIAEEADGDTEDAALLSAQPPKHLTVKTEIDGVTPVTTICLKQVSPLALFLVPFTLVWGGGSMTGIYGTQISKGVFDLETSLFGLPFLIGTIVLLSVCLFLLFGKRVLTLSAGKGTYFMGVGPIGYTKRFTYNYNTKVERDFTVYRGNRGGSSTTRFLRLSNDGESSSTTICSGFGEEALAYTAAVVRRECRRA